ncbi:hypothetical protein APW46_13280, partial [Staphylococcus aureus]
MIKVANIISRMYNIIELQPAIIPFSNLFIEDSEQLNSPDNWLYSTKFMLPKWLYKIAKQRADNKQLQNFGLYTKQPNV